MGVVGRPPTTWEPWGYVVEKEDPVSCLSRTELVMSAKQSTDFCGPCGGAEMAFGEGRELKIEKNLWVDKPPTPPRLYWFRLVSFREGTVQVIVSLPLYQLV